DELQELFTLLNDFKILCVIKKGIFGSLYINSFFESMWKANIYSSKHNTLFDGAPILITRNSNKKGLFNGNQGICLRVGKQQYFVLPRGGRFLFYPLAFLPTFELAYAMTIHKSQGSEYSDILVVLPEEEKHTLLTREILYTGITRAKKSAFVYANKTVLEKTIHTSIERETGIQIWQNFT
ncbi:MAG: ATP-binding domain-containing protein, partial [Spirochaetota bacterium]